MSSSLPRTVTAEIRYFNPKAPPEVFENGVLTLGEPPGVGREEFKRRRQLTTVSYDLPMVDARAVPGGIESFKLDVHGFEVWTPPPPVANFQNRQLVKDEYFPKLVELTKQKTGATNGYIFNFQRRTENPKNLSIAYARFAHCDAGPDSPPGWRQLLINRYNVPEAEANACDLCMLNYWHPWDRPAFKNPLCLMDCRSANLEPFAAGTNEGGTVRYNYVQSDESLAGRDKKAMEDGDGRKATDAMLSGGNADSNKIGLRVRGGTSEYAPPWGPTFAPGHKWYFCPDMRTDEMWVFKQYDTRPNVAKCSFHNSFHDPFHDNDPNCPGRRNCEFRMLLTFPKTQAQAAASKL